MVNEHQKLTPDREQNRRGFDQGYEYKLFGTFSPDKVYEPPATASIPSSSSGITSSSRRIRQRSSPARRTPQRKRSCAR
jgi:hypothetical protein